MLHRERGHVTGCRFMLQLWDNAGAAASGVFSDHLKQKIFALNFMHVSLSDYK